MKFEGWLAIIYFHIFSAKFFLWYHVSLKNENNVPKYGKNIMPRMNETNFFGVEIY